ncbi:MAG TPA: M23 family metallopeptidase [Kofleriaceae bacterium]|nr:M23 family metallopeptidase [Kofleriaceae bacterium]
MNGKPSTKAADAPVLDHDPDAAVTPGADAAPTPIDAGEPVDPDAMPGPATCDDNAKAGDYCGGDKVSGGDKNTLYTCDGPGPVVSAKKCPSGCVVAEAGSDDFCRIGTRGFRLPWHSGVTMQLTQDCNDSCCSDHVGNDKYAWDWANGGGFVIRAARAGTISHMKLSSSRGGADSSNSHYVNMIVVDHGDGSQSIYMHLKHDSAKGGIQCGDHVDRGQPLAVAGTTGHSTGIHLHYQVGKIHDGDTACNWGCGKDGLNCPADFNPFPSVWVSDTYPTVAVSFDEWPDASKCANRRITMPPSLN